MEKFNKVLAGNRIKSRRLELELTLSEIANMIGVAPSTICLLYTSPSPRDCS